MKYYQTINCKFCGHSQVTHTYKWHKDNISCDFVANPIPIHHDEYINQVAANNNASTVAMNSRH